MGLRRKELSGSDADFEQVMREAQVGHLGVIDADGFPRVVPLNFVCVDRRVYFHGARAGEKYVLLKAAPRVTFGACLPYSIIPSYWFDEEDACNVTAFYKSVHVRGVGVIVDEVEEAARALQGLMEKYQPEGGYRPIDVPLYEKDLRSTAVFRVDPVQVDVKTKFGQNLRPGVREMLMAKLEERAESIDLATAAEIRKL